MNKRKTVLFFVLVSLFISNSFSGIKFDNLTINSGDDLLYSVSHEIPGVKPYSTLFSLHLDKDKEISGTNLPDILTCYPEKIDVISGGKKLQVRNRWGTAIYDFDKSSLSWIARSSIIPEKSFSLGPIVSSPDGAWCVFVRKTGAQTGELIIENVETRKYVILDKNASFSFSQVPVKWSGTSRQFVYEKNGSVYFCNPENMFKGSQIEEKYRRIGNGTVESIQWASDEALVYIDRDIIYFLDSKELTTFGMYASIVTPGKIIGRLSEKFDPARMIFKTNRNVSEIVIAKENNFISYYKLDSANQKNFVKLINYKSYQDIFSDSFKFTILWPENSKPIIWTDMISDEGKKCSACYMFNETNDIVKIAYAEETVANPAVSPDGKYLAFAKGNSVFVYLISPWSFCCEIKNEKAECIAWKDNDSLVIGGTETVRLWKKSSSKESVLFLSSVKNVFWNYDRDVIAFTSDDKPYLYFKNLNTWKAVNETAVQKKAVVQNENFRVFTGKAANLRYDNAIFVRTLGDNVNTFSLYPETQKKSPAKKKIAISFDAVNNTDGINQILAVIRNYNLDCTFFINGEYIRRYPKETKKIAKCGFECGSMFYTPVDLTLEEFIIDSDYIKKGLARNEDEFFACTGKELSLIWHAPFYKTSQLIKQAGSEAGYSYIDFPVDQTVMESKAGKSTIDKVIPVTIGSSYDPMEIRYYEKLELLINTLLDSDYEIVPVSAL